MYGSSFVPVPLMALSVTVKKHTHTD